jgi:hypothetical protein
MKKKGSKTIILGHLLGIEQIAAIHTQVMDWLKNKDHIEISFQNVDNVDVSFIQWFIAFIRTAKLKPYTVVIFGDIPTVMLRNWEMIGLSVSFFDFLKDNHVTLMDEE